MKKRIFIVFILQIISISLFSQLKVAVVEDSLYSKSVNAYMRFNVVLPANYYLNDERYTTIYLLHGYSGNQDDWVTRTGLVSYAKEYNFIIITPDGKNSWYTNSSTVKNKNFEDYIMKDLIPFVDNKYRTLGTRHGRAIAGLSMGGYGAMKFGLKYPSTFFFAASFSGALQFPGVLESLYKSNTMKSLEPSLKETFGEVNGEHWKKNDPMFYADSASVANMPYLYISIGKDDAISGIVETNRTFTEKLRKRNALYEYHELPGVHNWVFWDKEISMVLWKISKFDPLKP
jgi:S-formylglutathione hydrolase FrmB